jgi:hypothetical protein
MVGGRSGRGHFVLGRAYSARYPARVCPFKQPPNPPIHSTCGIRAILVRLGVPTVGAITMVGASPPPAGDGPAVGRHIEHLRLIPAFDYDAIDFITI